MKTTISSLLIFLLLFIVNNDAWSASRSIRNHPTTISSTSGIYQVGYKPCWDQAGAYHNVDPWLLYAIASVESSFNPTAHHVNNNGTLDFGMMQINSVHFPELRKYGIPFEILADRCGSTYVGAWILSRTFKQCGRNWKAIAAYNTGSCSSGGAYAQKVAAAYRKYAPKRGMVAVTPNTYGQTQELSAVSRR